ncbi:glutamine amidotransferase [Vibrio phage Vp_R1]|uniref:Glutamine amidotransferase type-2 domain-containing protein n=1 Tax=Vibrio phage Vp_R1 TaxID=2059867 RepID=A0A2H5BQ19_9CAUD|nr:glutamine amidotransferase [Vibrio phage Vp_R1]AUG88431.1 hypothetical protein VPR_067 [Vibrio phage Vp_R1]
MCGIVLAGAKFPNDDMVGAFEKLLFADTFRGRHSTGVFTRRNYKHGDFKETVYPYFKAAVDGPDFLKTIGWDVLRNGGDPRYPRNFSNFYIGHNRYATMGEINSKNAHPFRHGDITMVHNGTLIDQSSLPDHTLFEVDSENICYSINKIGAAETIKNLEGAFTLIWHDASDETLHIIRNDERPFHLAETRCGRWFGASEELMLKWILDRSKSFTIKESFEIEVGKEYIFNVNDTFEFVEAIEREIADPWSFYGRNYGYGYGSSYGSWFNQPSVTPARKKEERATRKFQSVDSLLEENKLDLRGNSFFQFNSYDWNPYGKSSTNGQVSGNLPTDNPTDWIEVQCHGVLAENYAENGEMYGKVVGAFVKKDILTIVATYVSKDRYEDEIKKAEDSKEYCEICGEEGPADYVVTDAVGSWKACFKCKDKDNTIPFDDAVGNLEIQVGGEWFSKEDWNNHHDRHCGMCGMPIPFEEATDAIQDMGGHICYDCQESYKAIYGTEAGFRDSADAVFQCVECGVVKTDSEEAVPHMCRDCYADKDVFDG